MYLDRPVTIRSVASFGAAFKGRVKAYVIPAKFSDEHFKIDLT